MLALRRAMHLGFCPIGPLVQPPTINGGHICRTAQPEARHRASRRRRPRTEAAAPDGVRHLRCRSTTAEGLEAALAGVGARAGGTTSRTPQLPLSGPVLGAQSPHNVESTAKRQIGDFL
jgi:hypothetical protein